MGVGLGVHVDDARAQLGKPDAWQTRYVDEMATPFSQWFGGLLESRVGLALLRSAGGGELMLARRLAGQAPLHFVESALERGGNARVLPMAHCFCTPL